jgi:hypothetical protein
MDRSLAARAHLGIRKLEIGLIASLHIRMIVSGFPDRALFHKAISLRSRSGLMSSWFCRPP